MEIVLETRHNRDNCNKLCCEEGSSGNSFSGRVNIDDKGRGNSVLMELCCVLVIGGGLTLPRALCDICMTMRQRPLCPWEERNLQPPEGGRVASALEGGGGALAWIFFSRLITSTFPLPPSLFGIKMCVQWHVKFGYGNHVITSLNPIGSSPDTPAALIGRFVLTTGVIMNESSRLIGLSQVNFMSISTGNQNIDRKFGHF